MHFQHILFLLYAMLLLYPLHRQCYFTYSDHSCAHLDIYVHALRQVGKHNIKDIFHPFHQPPFIQVYKKITHMLCMKEQHIHNLGCTLSIKPQSQMLSQSIITRLNLFRARTLIISLTFSCCCWCAHLLSVVCEKLLFL